MLPPTFAKDTLLETLPGFEKMERLFLVNSQLRLTLGKLG
jgi:hypothetical protein